MAQSEQPRASKVTENLEMDTVDKFFADVHAWLQTDLLSDEHLVDLLRTFCVNSSPTKLPEHLEALQDLAQRAIDSFNKGYSLKDSTPSGPVKGASLEDFDLSSPWATIAWELGDLAHRKRSLQTGTTPMAICFQTAATLRAEMEESRGPAWNAHKNLEHAVKLIEDIHLLFRSCTWHGKIENVYDKNHELFFTINTCQSSRAKFMWILNPFAKIASESHAKAIRTMDRCSNDVAHLARIICFILEGICSAIEAVVIVPRLAPLTTTITLLRNSGEEIITDSGGSHRIAIRATLKTGQRYAIDLTGAEYGWWKTLMAWDDFMAERVKATKNVLTLKEFGDQTRAAAKLSNNGSKSKEEVGKYVAQDDPKRQIAMDIEVDLRLWINKNGMDMVSFLVRDEFHESNLRELGLHIYQGLGRTIQSWKKKKMYFTTLGKDGKQVISHWVEPSQATALVGASISDVDFDTELAHVAQSIFTKLAAFAISAGADLDELEAMQFLVADFDSMRAQLGHRRRQ